LRAGVSGEKRNQQREKRRKHPFEDRDLGRGPGTRGKRKLRRGRTLIAIQVEKPGTPSWTQGRSDQ